MGRIAHTSTLVVAVLVTALYAGEADAYLDAGAGSMIFQAILGAIVGGIVLIRAYWRRVVNRFRRGAPEDERSRAHKQI